MANMKIFFDQQRHVVCLPYTRENLHKAAELLGIKRCWFHARPYPHYDLPKRWSMVEALELDGRILDLEYEGIEVEEVSAREILKIIKGRRTA
jgi:hypothetical protein